MEERRSMDRYFGFHFLFSPFFFACLVFAFRWLVGKKKEGNEGQSETLKVEDKDFWFNDRPII